MSRSRPFVPDPRDIADHRAVLSSIVGGCLVCCICNTEDIACDFRSGVCVTCQTNKLARLSSVQVAGLTIKAARKGTSLLALCAEILLEEQRIDEVRRLTYDRDAQRAAIRRRAAAHGRTWSVVS